MRKEMNDIVLVDDNPAICYGLSEIFKRRGYAVRTASDGFSALALIRDRVPGVLLSDLDMPGMSGSNYCQSCGVDSRQSQSSR
jgi:CheY-like chemotaxis protein